MLNFNPGSNARKMKALGFVTFILFSIACNYGLAQEVIVFHIKSPHTSFPDTGRSKGHLYDKVLYTAAEHYNDSTVLIVAPTNLDAKKSVDLVFWFHGWHNNVDSAEVHYQLIRQFMASGLNAVLVLAETAKDSPDSYGGKLENTGVFKSLVSDVLTELKSKSLVSKNTIARHILLAGHSGAYRVIARIIQNGQMPVDEVILFDALYDETEKYMAWIKADQAHRFIDIYTDHGGTDGETRNMIKTLDTAKIARISIEESALTPQMLQNNRLVYIHSPHEHDKIIAEPDNFLLFLQNEPFLKKIK